MKTYSLNGVWQLLGKPQDAPCTSRIDIDAVVPGCVQLALSETGYLPEDLYMGENIRLAEKYEDWEWWYKRSFTSPDIRKNVYLVFDGVDCIAEYYLNGTKIGESENMFIRHEFRVDEFLVDGENTLEIHLKSAVIAAHNCEFNIKTLTAKDVYGLNIRKPPHSFGWDIMPRLVTTGLWRDVSIEVRDDIYFEQTFFHTQRDDLLGFFYVLNCDRNDFEDVEIELIGHCGEDSYFSKRERRNRRAGRIGFEVVNPKKWFPYGYGEPNVYDCVARIYRRGELVHEENFSFGIRKVTFERTNLTDGKSGTFRFLINDVEVMCKGTNWVPLDAFHCNDGERLDKALALLKDIGCNMVRCWGGNVYESDSFYDFCDRNGIMVWQDFAMACSFYPETEAFKKNLEQEVISVFRRLRSHPSLVIWVGDNEADSVALFHSTATNSITRETISKCIDLNDIDRPYLPSSPYIPGEVFALGIRSQRIGSTLSEDHLWGVRDYYKSDFYKNNMAHFISEIGYPGCPPMESIRKFITPDKVWPYTDNSEWILHSSDQDNNPYRVNTLEDHVRQLFDQFPRKTRRFCSGFTDFSGRSNEVFYRKNACQQTAENGNRWWNLLDGWPQMSDAVVDYYFTKKLAYDYIKRAQAPFTIAADEPLNRSINIYACNDTLEVKSGTLTITDAFTKEVLFCGTFEAKENASTVITTLPTFYSEHKFLLFNWEANGEKGFNHYLCAHPPISFDLYKQFINEYLS